MTTTIPFTKKPFASSILLWIRTDQPRQQGMDYWKGPHSKIISPTPGFDEYRQIHIAETNPGLWPATPGVETAIPADRRIDGVAEVTFASVLSPLLGRKQTRLAYQDEINVFRRTLLYAGPPNSTRWYDVAEPGEKTGARALIYIRRREGVGTRPFRKFVTDELVPALANTGVMTELRTQVFMPWNEKLWDTPNVAHDNPTDQRFHASLIFGFKGSRAGGLLRRRGDHDALGQAVGVRVRRPRLRRVRGPDLRQGRRHPPALPGIAELLPIPPTPRPRRRAVPVWTSLVLKFCKAPTSPSQPSEAAPGAAVTSHSHSTCATPAVRRRSSGSPRSAVACCPVVAARSGFRAPSVVTAHWRSSSPAPTTTHPPPKDGAGSPAPCPTPSWMPSSTPSSPGSHRSTAPRSPPPRRWSTGRSCRRMPTSSPPTASFAHSLTLPGFLSRATGFQALFAEAGIDVEYRLGSTSASPTSGADTSHHE